MPQHLVAHDRSTGRLVGAVPLFLKSHSYGEFVYDQSWARAYRSNLKDAHAKSSYYPKLLAGVPFTPVTGPRLLVAERDPARRAELRGLLARGMVALADRLAVSSAHVNFCMPEERRALRHEGFLPRLGMQYHWRNHNYSTFADFLGSLKSAHSSTV